MLAIVISLCMGQTRALFRKRKSSLYQFPSKVSHTGWLKPTEITLQLWRVEVQNQNVGKILLCFFLSSQFLSYFLLSFFLPSFFLPSFWLWPSILGITDFQPHHSALCLHYYMAFSLCPNFSLIIRTPVMLDCCCLVAQPCPTLFVTPWTLVFQVPLSVGFPSQEYWSEQPFPSPGDLPDPGMQHVSPALAGGFFTTEPLGKPYAGLGPF